jgi:processive rubber oxygenase RoxA-like protein
MMFSAVAGTILQNLQDKLFGRNGRSPGDGFGFPSRPDGQTAPPAARTVSQASSALAGTSGPIYSVQAAGQQVSLTIEPGTFFERTIRKGEYEARVLEGIWAAAPYLHNGSVPTLAELLKPPAQRTAQFSVGSKYDIEKVGLAVTQPGSDAVRSVTDCNEINSGNSRCGHDFGTDLSEQQKKALIEYLKTL